MEITAAVLRSVGGPFSIERIDLAPPKRDEVRVRVAAAGICHSDWHFVSGDLSWPLPAVLGHEGAGIVEEVGPDVTLVAPGDHVVLLWKTSCGRCEMCQTGVPMLCDVGLSRRASGLLNDGTSRLSNGAERIHHLSGVSCFAERLVCSERSVLPIGSDVPLEIAALVGCAVVTGAGAVLNTARVRAGSSVAVIGTGGVGLSAVMAARLAGARTIIAIDLVRSKLDLALELGATAVVDASHDDAVEATRRLAGGDGVDYAFEAIGLASTVGQAFAMLRRRGTAVAIGSARPDARAEISAMDLVRQERTLKGSSYGSARPAVDIPRLLDLFRSGRLPLERLLTRRFGLAEIDTAFRALLAGEVARSVVVP